MAAVATITIGGQITGLPGGNESFNLKISSLAAVGQRLSPQTLAVGDNTITVPAGTTLVIFIPPTSNTQVVLLKGNAADVGVSLHRTNPSLICLNSAQASFILNAAAQITGCEIIFV